MWSRRIRQMTGAHWLVLFALILGSWTVLYLMAVPDALRLAGRVYGADLWAGLCVVTPDAAGFMRIVAMWVLMSAAMMAPSALPAFATYDDLSHAVPDTRFSTLVLGYMAVWLGFSVFAATLQMALFQSGALSAFGDSRSVLLSAGLLGVAGIYQFSAVKDACLSKCRQPMTFFMQHWDEGPLRNGLRLGLACLGCCWALMLLAFVGGVMSLGFMGLATVIMTFEKLPDLGRYLTRPLGAILIGAAVWLALNGIT